METQRIMVTGGAGFIGSNFVKYMLEKYPDAEIRTLLPEKKKDKVDKGLDFFVALL